MLQKHFKHAAILWLLLFTTFFAGEGSPANIHNSKDHVSKPAVQVDEKLGEIVSMDAVFYDQAGKKTTIRELVTKPTLILPIFYTCKNVCGLMLGNLAVAINRVPLKLGKEYNVVALSFDSSETPDVARQSRDNYIKLLEKKPVPGVWKFLTGDKSQIKKFTDSVGFYYNKVGEHDFIHPNVLIAVGIDGKIIRYLYGPSFLPFDIGMALTEAEKGTPSLSVRKILSLCFTYESEKKRYSFQAIRVISAVILGTLGAVLFFLLRKKKTNG